MAHLHTFARTFALSVYMWPNILTWYHWHYRSGSSLPTAKVCGLAILQNQSACSWGEGAWSMLSLTCYCVTDYDCRDTLWFLIQNKGCGNPLQTHSVFRPKNMAVVKNDWNGLPLTEISSCLWLFYGTHSLDHSNAVDHGRWVASCTWIQSTIHQSALHSTASLACWQFLLGGERIPRHWLHLPWFVTRSVRPLSGPTIATYPSQMPSLASANTNQFTGSLDFFTTSLSSSTLQHQLA